MLVCRVLSLVKYVCLKVQAAVKQSLRNLHSKSLVTRSIIACSKFTISQQKNRLVKLRFLYHTVNHLVLSMSIHSNILLIFIKHK